MCINLTNEQLQMYFNKHVFDAELQECIMEGVPPVGVTIADNKPTIDLYLQVRLSAQVSYTSHVTTGMEN